MTSTRFHVTVERWTAGSGWTECIPCYLTGWPSLGRGDSTLHWIFQTERYFCFLTFWETASGSSDSSALVWRAHSTGGQLGCLAARRSAASQNGPALFFFLSFLLFPCGWILFCFVLLVSLRRNFYWGKEPVAALPQGGGLPMNVRLKSPAKGAVQSAGHALLTGAGPQFN